MQTVKSQHDIDWLTDWPHPLTPLPSWSLPHSLSLSALCAWQINKICMRAAYPPLCHLLLLPPTLISPLCLCVWVCVCIACCMLCVACRMLRINCINKFIDFNCCRWLVKYFAKRFMLSACKFVCAWCCCCPVAAAAVVAAAPLLLVLWL